MGKLHRRSEPNNELLAFCSALAGRRQGLGGCLQRAVPWVQRGFVAAPLGFCIQTKRFSLPHIGTDGRSALQSLRTSRNAHPPAAADHTEIWLSSCSGLEDASPPPWVQGGIFIWWSVGSTLDATAEHQCALQESISMGKYLSRDGER